MANEGLGWDPLLVTVAGRVASRVCDRHLEAKLMLLVVQKSQGQPPGDVNKTL